MPHQVIDQKWIGHELAPSIFEVERGRLRAFARAIGECDPVYTNVEAAREAGYRDLPAPPTFLFAAELDSGRLFALLDEMGLPLERVLHAEQGFAYFATVCAGDTITVKSKITDIYAKKDGALQFVRKTSDAHNQRDEHVACLSTLFVVRNS
jgi:acyl dehydratase